MNTAKHQKNNDDLHVVFQLSNSMIHLVYIGPEVYTLNFMINKVFLELETQQIPFQQVPLLLIQLDEGAAIFGQRHLRRSHVDTIGLENNFPDLQHVAIFKLSNIKYEYLTLHHKRVEEELEIDQNFWEHLTLLLVFLNFYHIFFWDFILFIEFERECSRKMKGGKGFRRKNKRFWSLLILLLSVAYVRKKIIKTTYTEERSVHTNSESCNIRLRS